MDMMHQVRKALNDIQHSFESNNAERAELEVFWLRKMIDEQPSRHKPWSEYQLRIDEEFE